VIEALRRRLPEVGIEIFTSVPQWFFRDSISTSVGYHCEALDHGLVQTTALAEDLGASADALQQSLPFSIATIDTLADKLSQLALSLVLCDIAPLGLAAARRAGLPSVLIENFTWSWIFHSLAIREPRLARAAELMQPYFALADHRIQTEPFCQEEAGALQVPPVSRRPRSDRGTVRRALGIPEDEAMVLVTMGGIVWDYGSLEAMEQSRGATSEHPWLVIPGAGDGARVGRTIPLPQHSDFYHPDLIHAADGVLGKLGYSTVAEVYRNRLPFAYVPRPGFPESPVLEEWVRAHLPHLRILPAELTSHAWLAKAAALVALRPGQDRGIENERSLGSGSFDQDNLDGASRIADHIHRMLI
jgi:hypothetical protein